MEWLFAILVGGLYSAGLYLMLQRNMFKLVLGMCLVSHGANLLIFTAGGLTRNLPPIFSEATSIPSQITDPLPQAFVLTAIVISFGVTAFLLVLVHRTHKTLNTDDVDDLIKTDLQ